MKHDHVVRDGRILPSILKTGAWPGCGCKFVPVTKRGLE